ncbi:MAG: hypothetical protein ACXU9U_04420 [Parachlamydiaceae bacterium]
MHTYSMAETRLILDCELLPGKQHASCYSLPRLIEIIDELPSHKRPKLIRSDCAFGNDNVISPLEERKIPYLFKIKPKKKLKIFGCWLVVVKSFGLMLGKDGRALRVNCS